MANEHHEVKEKTPGYWSKVQSNMKSAKEVYREKVWDRLMEQYKDPIVAKRIYDIYYRDMKRS